MRIVTYNLCNLFDAGPREGYGGAIVVSKEFAEKVADNIRSVVDAIGPDVLVAQEIGSERLFRQIGEATKEQRTAFVATPDARGIANGVLLRVLAEARSLPDMGGFPVFREGDADMIGATLNPYRSFVYVRTNYSGAPLHVFGVHLKTSWGMPMKNSSGEKISYKDQSDAGDALIRALVYKLSQARRLRRLLDELFAKEPEAQIIVTGDFNAEAGAEALRIIKGELNDSATQLTNLCDRVPEEKRFSYMGEGRKRLIDHMLVSTCVLEKVHTIEIFNATLKDHSGQPEDAFFESDHAPVALTLVGG